MLVSAIRRLLGGDIGTNIAPLWPTTGGNFFNHSNKDFIMRFAAEKEMAHIGETSAAADHDHDMIHELSKRLDAVWRMDQYIANAEGDAELQDFWRELKGQEQGNVAHLKRFVAAHCAKHCF